MKTLVLLMVYCVFLVSGEGSSEECGCEEGEEIEIGCPNDLMLPTAIASRGQFFRDAVGGSCRNMGEEMVSDEEEIITFPSTDSGMSVSAACPHEHQVVHKMKFCRKEKLVTAVTLHCRMLINPEWIRGPHKATSEDRHHTFVECNEDSFIRAVAMKYLEDEDVTTVAFDCLRLQIDDEYSLEER